MVVNGKEMAFNNISIVQLLDELNLNRESVVVEANLVIVSKEQYGETILKKGDQVEIISFVGGG